MLYVVVGVVGWLFVLGSVLLELIIFTARHGVFVCRVCIVCGVCVSSVFLCSVVVSLLVLLCLFLAL